MNKKGGREERFGVLGCFFFAAISFALQGLDRFRNCYHGWKGGRQKRKEIKYGCEINPKGRKREEGKKKQLPGLQVKTEKAGEHETELSKCPEVLSKGFL